VDRPNQILSDCPLPEGRRSETETEPRALASDLPVLPKKLEQPTTAARRWMRYAGTVTTGMANSSQTVDEVVYGENV
jgi:hypothetical protein